MCIAKKLKLRLSYNDTQKLKYNSLDRRARKIIKLNFPSIENLANCERVLLWKVAYAMKSCNESNEEFNNFSNCLNIYIKPEITRKA